MKVDLVPGITPVSVASVEQTADELATLIRKCRGTNADHDLGVPTSARKVAEIAHRSSASLVAMVEHPAADPAMLLGILAPIVAPLDTDAAVALRGYLADDGGVDIQEVVAGRSPRGYPVVFAERVVTVQQMCVGEPFDCQVQAVVADPARPRIAVFTLSSTTGRGWLELSALFGRLIASVSFDG